MMRSLWIALSTLALANLMALGALALWLKTSDRLSRERVEQVRQIFKPTLAQESAAKQAEKDAAEKAAKDAEEQARSKKPPVTAEQRLEIIREYEETQRQRTERLQRETKDLLTQLDIRKAELEKQQAAFVAERNAFEAMRDEMAAAVSNEQFAKTLKLYEAVKASEAAAMMQTLLAGGKKSQVVAYLNQMQPRSASKVIAEFQKRDPMLAADLLEGLRSYGTVPQATAPSSSRAASTADAQRPAKPGPSGAPAPAGSPGAGGLSPQPSGAGPQAERPSAPAQPDSSAPAQ